VDDKKRTISATSSSVAFNKMFILQLLKVFLRWLDYTFRSENIIQFKVYETDTPKYKFYQN